MAELEHKPGEQVPESGVYRVAHQQHRADHHATLFRGEHFPRCAHCGDQVRFQLVGKAAAIGDDADFRK
jgi:hypothetical protein